MLDRIFSLDTLWWFLLLLYIPACLGLIVVVLLQKGKGVGFAGAFGVGAGSEAVFGPRTARSLPQKLTYTAAGLFMLLALVMSTLSGSVGKGRAPGLVEEESIQSEGAGSASTMDELFGGATADVPGEVGVIKDPEAQVDLTTSLDVSAETAQPIVPEDKPAETPATAPEAEDEAPATAAAPAEAAPAEAAPAAVEPETASADTSDDAAAATGEHSDGATGQ